MYLLFNPFTRDKKAVTMKKCAKCGKEKSLSDFNTDTYSKDQLSSYCRDCNKLRAKAWREQNKEHIKEYKTRSKKCL